MAERGLMRWVGSKRQHVARIVPMIDAHRRATGGRLVSLFYGSGAIERAAGECKFAADASPDLLALYADLQDYGARAVFEAMCAVDRGAKHTKAGYNAVRAEGDLPAPARSGRFLWLSAMCFNGLWRVNSRGAMNVAPDPARLKAGLDALPPLAAFETFAEQIRDTTFLFGWEKALFHARPGDVLFVDSPYGAFDSYTAGGFGSRDHRLLASALKEAAGRGIAVIAFNAPEAAAIYRWAKCEEVARSGCVNSKTSERDQVAEIVITAGLAADARAA